MCSTECFPICLIIRMIKFWVYYVNITFIAYTAVRKLSIVKEIIKMREKKCII